MEEKGSLERWGREERLDRECRLEAEGRPRREVEGESRRGLSLKGIRQASSRLEQLLNANSQVTLTQAQPPVEVRCPVGT